MGMGCRYIHFSEEECAGNGDGGEEGGREGRKEGEKEQREG